MIEAILFSLLTASATERVTFREDGLRLLDRLDLQRGYEVVLQKEAGDSWIDLWVCIDGMQVLREFYSDSMYQSKASIVCLVDSGAGRKAHIILNDSGSDWIKSLIKLNRPFLGSDKLYPYQGFLWASIYVPEGNSNPGLRPGTYLYRLGADGVRIGRVRGSENQERILYGAGENGLHISNSDRFVEPKWVSGEWVVE